jgi:hypothetical protein
MTRKKTETATVTISKRAAALVREIAAADGCTPRQYLEALLHYGGSCHKRPGSWEAAQPFDLQMYLREDCLADRWF